MSEWDDYKLIRTSNVVFVLAAVALVVALNWGCK
jgi:hypothetical protein